MASSLQQFFGGNKGALLYVNAMDSAIATGFENSTIQQLMRAENYVDYSKTHDDQGHTQGPNDVHQDFTDLIIQAAWTHGKIDNIIKIDKTMSEIHKESKLDNAHEFLTNVLDAVPPYLFENAEKFPISEDGKSAILNCVEYKQGPKTGVCTTILNESVKLFGTSKVDMNEFKQKFSVKVTEILRNYVEYIIAYADTQRRKGVNYVNFFSNVGYDIIDKKMKVIDELITSGNQIISSLSVKKIYYDKHQPSRITLESEEAFDLFMNIYGEWDSLPANIRNFYNNVLDVIADKNSALISRSQVPSIRDEVRLTEDEIKNAVSMFKKNARNTSGERDNLRLNFKKSDDMKPVFSESYIPIIQSDREVYVWYTRGSYNRIQVESGKELRFIYKTIYELSLSGANRIDNYPFQFDYTQASQHWTHDLSLNYPVFLRNVQEALDRADLAKRGECPELSSPSGSCGEDLPNFIEYGDLAYGKVWHWDSTDKIFYRMEGSNRINYHDDIASNTDNCYGSFLKGSSEQCKRLIDCLADGDLKSFGLCMDVLADKDLWDVASDDVAKVNPTIVRAVLRKFRVRGKELLDDTGVKYRVPMTFEEWEEGVLNSDEIPENVRSSIKNNSKLLSYFKGLLAVCSANPSILNKRNPVLARKGLYGEAQKISDYAEKLGKKLYRDPRDDKNEYAIAAAQLRSLPYGSLSPSLFSQSIGSLHNASFYSRDQIPMLFGGAYSGPQSGGFVAVNRALLTKAADLSGKQLVLKDGSSSIFENLFTLIQTGLHDMGIGMDPSDRQIIENANRKLKEIEQKMLAIFRRLSITTRIGENLGAQNLVTDRQHVAPIKLEDVRTNESAIKFMENHIKELRKTYDLLNGHYSDISSNLVTHIYPKYLDRCCEPRKSDKKVTNFVDLFSETC